MELEAKRDEKYIQDVFAQVEHYREKATQYKKEHAAFIAQFNGETVLQDVLPYLAFAQEHSMEKYDEKSDEIDFTKGQHPHYAISAGVIQGNCAFAIGPQGRDIGVALALRQPDANVLYHKADLTYAAGSFFALAKWKGMSAVIHVRDAGNLFIEALYHYYRGQEVGDYTSAAPKNDALKDFINNKYILEYIESVGRELYDEVTANGFKFYEALLSVDNDEYELLQKGFKNAEAEGFAETTASRFIRAMEIQQLLWDRDAIIKSGYAPDNVMVIFQERMTGREYLYIPERNYFIVIPDADEDNPAFAERKKKFIDRLPRRETWREAAPLMMDGARYYRHYLKLQKAVAKRSDLQDLNPYVVSCSDSRSLPEFIVQTGLDLLTVAFRNPGAFISREGQMMGDAGRFFALAQYNKKKVVLSPHTNCGAETAIDTFFNGDSDTIPDAFAHLADHRLRLVKTVLNKGAVPAKTDTVATIKGRYKEKDILDYYSELSGIPLTAIADCLSVQQLFWDIEVAEKEFERVPFIAVCQHMPDCQNYVYNPKVKKFVAVAFVENNGRLPKKQACCGCGHH